MGKDTPLALYVYSQSSSQIEKTLSAVTSGGVCVNSSMEHIMQPGLPFGGKGGSGMGQYHGKFGFDEFSHHRAVFQKSTLPLCRAPLMPLPIDGKPLPDFVFPLLI